MTIDPAEFDRTARIVVWFAAAAAALAVTAVIVERIGFAVGALRQRRFDARYGPLAARALAGDAAAEQTLLAARRYRFRLGLLLVLPLVDDRRPDRIRRTRQLVERLSLLDLGERMLKSRRWWRRALALRAMGLLRLSRYTAAMVAALDDRRPEVRAAALDALADVGDPASLHAVVSRLLDTSLHRGRRVAALAAFGAAAEPMLLDLALYNPASLVSYTRALGLCGTAASIPSLCRWTADGQPAVRAAAFEALARIGPDEPAAARAIDALDDGDPAVRVAAARALRGWTGAGDAAAHLAQHLDDQWAVAAQAARSLQSIVPAGAEALRASAGRADLAGTLARQMLWELRVSV